jgi:multidrug resistance protein, MATE family
MTSRSALRFPTRREILDVARLAGPIVVVQVGIMLMGAVDAAMLGRVSPTAMGAVALGNFYWLLIVVLGQGILQVLDPVIAQAVGAADGRGIRHGIQRGFILALVLSVPSALLMLSAEPVLIFLRQPADVARLAGHFAVASIPGVVAFYAFTTLRQTLQAFGRVAPIVWTVVIANVANAIFDWVLIFGHLGFSPHGVVGSAWATAASRWLLFLGLFLLAWGDVRPHIRGSWRESFDARALGGMLRLGLPIGIHQWLEISAFGGALILMGTFGTVALAGHQIAITLAALTYMVPLGTASAAAVLVGHAIGRSDPDGARREAGAALVCGVGFMLCAALALIASPRLLARIFTAEPEVIALAVTLIPVAGVFQVFDGVQGVSSGILRGAADTRIPMLLNLFGFVCVGLPAAWWLSRRTPLGPAGVWWGMLAALMVVAALLGWRVHTRLRGALERVDVDGEVQHEPRDV